MMSKSEGWDYRSFAESEGWRPEDAARAFGFSFGTNRSNPVMSTRDKARTVLLADPFQRSVLVTRLCERLNMDRADVLDKIRRLAV